MRYGVFADIHANEEAFDAVFKCLRHEHIDSYICAGDVVGYGASPIGVIDKIVSLKAVTVAGNHDWAVVDKFPLDFFNRYAKTAVAWTKKQLSETALKFLSSLALCYQNEDCAVVHGTLSSPGQFSYLLDVHAAKLSFDLLKERVCFLGHSHIAGVFVEDERHAIRYSREFPVNVEKERRYIVNVGSVGQPRDGDYRASCAVYDTKERSIALKRIDYDAESARKRIINAGLPVYLGDRLLKGN